ncbi:unnamed protein product [Prorocentrum cordatum]|uniref:Phospholipase B-like n=1 Tax=Prorocentrum cordatum TaxID=2364126 RepID=A0ABN9WGH3_9DINO|nr:unnamed protein product [Polarella glacialis]
MLLLQGLPALLLVSCGSETQLYSSEQEAFIRRVAQRTTFDESSCPGMEDPLTDTEVLYSSEAAFKFFGYDTHDVDSWALLQNLQGCLEGVSAYDWLGGQPNLWEASKQPYSHFARVVDPRMWEGGVGSEYQEDNPVNTSNTVIGSAAASTMSSFARDTPGLALKQPCNALSNAAFYQLALTVCSQPLPSIGGWPWDIEARAAANLLAFGSFAFHGNPFGGDDPPAGYDGPWSPISTQFLDVIGMQAYFYLLHQATVHSIVSPSTPADDKTALLKIGMDGYLEDARVAVQDLTRIFTQDPDTWKAEAEPLSQKMPEYMVSAVGTTLVALRAILHDELFGRSVAVAMYELACSSLVDALLGGAQSVKDTFCDGAGTFVTQLNAVTLNAPRDIAKAMGLLISGLQVFVEALFWQETKAKPVSYLDQWRQAGVIGPTLEQCWLQPHSTWHRVCGYTTQRLTTLISQELPSEMLEPPLTEDQKHTSWRDAAGVAAKECASSAPFCTTPPAQSLLEPCVVNDFLVAETSKLDPLTGIASDSGDVPDPLNVCFFTYSVTLDSISGLSGFKLRDLAITHSYADGPIRTHMNISTTTISLTIEGEATITRNGKKYGWGECSLMEVTVNLGATLKFEFEADLIVDTDLQTILGLIDDENVGDAFAIMVHRMKPTCHDLTLQPLSAGIFGGLLMGVANGILKVGLVRLACELLEPEVTRIVREQASGAARVLGQHARLPQRRLEGSCPTSLGADIVSAAGPRKFMAVLPLALLGCQVLVAAAFHHAH